MYFIVISDYYLEFMSNRMIVRIQIFRTDWITLDRYMIQIHSSPAKWKPAFRLSRHLPMNTVPAGARRCFYVVTTFIQRRDIALTLSQHKNDVMFLLGNHPFFKRRQEELSDDIFFLSEKKN